MIEWLLPIGLFWVIASIFFGGLIDAENGSGARQFLGLLACFALYLAVFWVLRAVLGSSLGILGRVILPVAIPSLLLGRLGRVAFLLVGVKIKPAVFGADAH